VRTAAVALQALRARPCAARVLAVLEEMPGAWVVGGAVRDALLGRTGHHPDLDVVVEGDPERVVRALGEPQAVHGRFGTFDVVVDGCHVDVVRARAESYVRPGALPDVRPAGLHDDLARRDFTVNAIALGADGALRSVSGALEDLEGRRLRVLHDQSFRDDPTRLWRLVRYAVRLGFMPDEETDRLAVEAVRGGALDTVSGDRLGTELRLALGEPSALAVLHAAQNLGLVDGLRLDPALVTEALDLLPAGGRRDLTLLGAVIPDPAWPAPFGFTAAEAHVLARCAAIAPVVADRPSRVAQRLRGEPVEAVAVAGARGDRPTAALFLAQWRDVRLEIDGRDLLIAGIPEGPEIGRRLARVLARRLDGELAPGREAELAAALEDAP
jgi:tRNA nucleotidyltransferase (CCA-adding enzyme)